MLLATIVKEKYMDDLKLIEIIYGLSDKCIVHRNKHLEKMFLSKAEFNGLICLEKHSEITCKEFSERMGLSLSRGSRIIDRLHQKNFIKRTDSPSDRRCKLVQLSEKGKKARNQIDKEKERCEKKLTSGIPQKKLDRLKKELLELMEKL